MCLRVAGKVGLSDDKLVFPRLPSVAAIYRLTFANSAGRPRIYIGETDNLRRRVGNYRNPGPTQQTSQRLHDELVRHLTAGGTVSLSIAIEAEIETDGQHSVLPLARKTARVLAEHAALARAYVDDVADIMNADRGEK
ncbi:GIY-YIG nuclease family protein [Lentzea sp. E54]|uniref:GIY-YIG nuclease family protein n=1 Tax=Lentzea xerophila TaxID=3435883 RepID=UPI003DA3A520